MKRNKKRNKIIYKKVFRKCFVSMLKGTWKVNCRLLDFLMVRAISNCLLQQLMLWYLSAWLRMRKQSCSCKNNVFVKLTTIFISESKSCQKKGTPDFNRTLTINVMLRWTLFKVLLKSAAIATKDFSMKTWLCNVFRTTKLTKTLLVSSFLKSPNQQRKNWSTIMALAKFLGRLIFQSF